MSAGRSASLCWTLLSVCLLASSSAEIRTIPAEPGQNVTLPCKALNNDPVIVLEWSRTDLKPEEELLVYRDERFVTVNQNPSYKNRVDLQDRQMKDGDVSLILNNVKTEDRGTYECYIVQNKRQRNKRAVGPISTIRLEVAGHHRGHPGLIAGVVVLTLVVAVSLITVRHMKKKSSPPPSSSSSPPLQSADQPLVHLL